MHNDDTQKRLKLGSLGASRALFFLIFPWPAMASYILVQMILRAESFEPFWPAPPLLVALLAATLLSQRFFIRNHDHNKVMKICRIILLISGIMFGPVMEVLLYRL